MHQMKKNRLATLLVIFLISCAAKAPVAKINYMGIEAVGFSYHLLFAADVPILELFSENKHQRIVFSELVCSLDTDHNFDIEHKLKYFAQSGFKFLKQTTIAEKKAYVFDADIEFREAPADEMGNDQSIAKEKLTILLKDKKSIPCKIRMTVDFSTPYYSETFLVPATDILAAVSNRLVQ